MRARLNEILIELNRRNLLTKSMLIRMCEQNPEIGAYYAAYVIEQSWPEGEKYIARSARASYLYAKLGLLRNRFPAGEEVISKDGNLSYLYAAHCLGKPFPMGEEAIANTEAVADQYCVYVLNLRSADVYRWVLQHRSKS